MCLEETRSTLQFAARAKQVKTNARVNEILDDDSVFKKFQRELEEARRQANGTGVKPEHLESAEKKPASAGSAAREAEERLKRLQASILNSGLLLLETEEDEGKFVGQKRRLSDGCLGLASSETPRNAVSQTGETNTVPRMNKATRAHIASRVEPDAELALYKQALHAKSSSLQKQKNELAEALRNVELNEVALADALTKLETVTLERDKRIQNLGKSVEEQRERPTDLNESFLKSRESNEDKDSYLILSTEDSSLNEGIDSLREGNSQLKSSFFDLEESDNMTIELSWLSTENQSLRPQLEAVGKHGEDVLEESHTQTLYPAEETLCKMLDEQRKENTEELRVLKARLDDTLQDVAGLEREIDDLKTGSRIEMDQLKSWVSVLQTSVSALIEEREKSASRSLIKKKSTEVQRIHAPNATTALNG